MRLVRTFSSLGPNGHAIVKTLAAFPSRLSSSSFSSESTCQQNESDPVTIENETPEIEFTMKPIVSKKNPTLNMTMTPLSKSTRSTIDLLPSITASPPLCPPSPSPSTASSSSSSMPYKFVDPNAKIEYPIASYPLNAETKRILEQKGIAQFFPIQAETFQEIMAGKDVLARARTGTGKTLGFALPSIQYLHQLKAERVPSQGKPKILVVTPTRELSIQVTKEFRTFGPSFKYVNAYGGSAIRLQENALHGHVDVVIGTPGRLLDLLGRGALSLDEVHTLILDEADHMLDLGFKDSLESLIAAIPAHAAGGAGHQTCLFSATVPDWVHSIAAQYFCRPERIYIDAVGETKIRTSEKIKQVAIPYKGDDLSQFVSQVVATFAGVNGRSIVFCETKNQVDSLASTITLLPSSVSSTIGNVGKLHGDLTQSAREMVLNAFRHRQLSCIVATDVAARGLDIADVDLVVQLEPPAVIDTFIHRAGRTARAGKGGTNVLLFDPAQHAKEIRDIEKEAGFKFLIQGVESGKELNSRDPNTFVRQALSVTEEEKESAQACIDALLEEMKTPEAALESAIALLYRDICLEPTMTRSLLTGEKGYTTFLLKLRTPNPNDEETSYHYQHTGRRFSLESTEDVIQEIVQRARFLKSSDIPRSYFLQDKSGLLFDVPLKLAPLLRKFQETSEFGELGSVMIPSVLPDYTLSTLSKNARHASSASASYRSGPVRSYSQTGGYHPMPRGPRNHSNSSYNGNSNSYSGGYAGGNSPRAHATRQQGFGHHPRDFPFKPRNPSSSSASGRAQDF